MNTKKSLVAVVAIVFIFWSIAPAPLYASRSKYYDYGPYYQRQQVLGFSFSALENLPVPQIPDNIIPAPATGILPGSPFYPLERLWENTQVAFTPDPVNREELWLKIAAERLSEGKTLMEQGKTETATSALIDYSKTMTTVAQNLSTLTQQNNAAAQSLAAKVEEIAAAQAVVTQSLALAAPPAQAQAWNQALEGANAALDEAAEAQGAPAVPEELSNSIQKLKEEGILSEEESNKIYSLGSRSEVREELEKLTTSGQLPVAELAKLDTAVADKYPQVYEQQAANLQVAELRSYQSLPQPSDEVVEGIKKWQEDPSVPPPNDIKPYLWYNRAQELATEVDLSNFTPDQQTDVAKFYPQAVTENPTYVPPPPTPTPSQPQATDQTASPAASPVPTGTEAIPSPTGEPAAQLYLGATGGGLPGDPTYFIKRWGEDLSVTFTFDPAEKARLKIQHAERRLSEATAISTDSKKAALYANVLEDYEQALTGASTYLKNASDSPSVKEVARQLENQASRHEVVWEKGLLPTPKDPALISEAIKATENAMDQSADTLDRPALPPLLASRLGDLKAQGLLLPEEADDLTRSESRTQVREKIRELVELGTFPTADAKKLDEAQALHSPTEYNQLVEVRKVEELQKLRATQTDFAQTPTLRATAATLTQRENALVTAIEPSLITEKDLAGRENLIKTYQTLMATASARPINGGQFGPEATPGAKIVLPPPPSDVVLSICPIGTTFKQFEGCVWADNGRRVNDYDQYKCDGPRQYYSFAAKRCVSYEPVPGRRGDTEPICPVGYDWSWQTQSCQGSSVGGLTPSPSPTPEVQPIDEKERAKRSQSCPEGATYKVPDGCVWDDTKEKVTNEKQYLCERSKEYYSFEKHSCVPIPKPGEAVPGDAAPTCKDSNSSWSWSEDTCVPWAKRVVPIEVKDLTIPEPFFVPPDNPFYFLKQGAERARQVLTFTPQAREQVSLDQAKERLAEAVYALKKDDEQGVKKALTTYTTMMQNLVGDMSKAQLTNQGKYEIGQLLAKEAAEHNLLLQKLSAWAPQEQDSAISAAVSVTVLSVDKAADIAGEPPIPPEVKSKIEALPDQMMPEEEKKKLLEASSRVEARLKLSAITTTGALTAADTSFLNEDFDAVDEGAKAKLEELKKLEEIATITKQKAEVNQKVEKNEDIVGKLAEFEKTFEPGKDIPAEVRPYVRLTRINEVAQTIRPDMVRLEDFQNRKDVMLAVATLQQEFRPTRDSFRLVEEFRRKNPNAALPLELARIEALSFGLGVRETAGPCFLPTPPFPANTPCPAPGAAIPIASFIGPRPVDEGGYRPGYPGTGWFGTTTPNVPSTDKDGKPLVYGQGPKAENAGVCPDGFHWMYDSGGWCMSNSGNYSSSYTYTPTGTGTGYTPYSPYYTAPGAPPSTYGYTDPSSFTSRYSPPNYWGPAPTYYTTNPPAGTVPGSGPKPTAPGQCPSGFHWMSDSGGWCMADGPTYTPASWQSGGLLPGTSTSGTPPPGGYNCGSQSFNPATGKCNDGACPGGYSWDGSRCAVPSPNLTSTSCGPGYYWSNNACFPNNPQPSSPGSSYQYGCTPGYYWDGSKCVAGSYSGSGWSDTAARTQSWCQPPSGGCGSNSYWDYGSCYCRSSSTYSGGGGPSPSNQCQGLSCGGGAWLDYATCSCRYSGSSTPGTSSTGSTITCYPPSQGCPGGWYDYGTCSCKISSSTTTTGTSTGSSCGGPPSAGCPGGWYDWGSCSCQTSSSTSTSSGGGGGGTSTGSCPSGYHWMDGSPGWCMADGGGGTTTTDTSTTTSGGTTTTSTTTTTTTTSGGTTTSDTTSGGGTTTTSGTDTSGGGTAPSSGTTTTPQ